MVEAAARLHAMESGAWVIVSTQYNPEEVWSDGGNDRPKWRSVGGSCIASPAGEFVAGPVYGEETIVYADIDPAARRATKFAWDPVAKDGRRTSTSFGSSTRARTRRPRPRGSTTPPRPPVRRRPSRTLSLDITTS